VCVRYEEGVDDLMTGRWERPMGKLMAHLSLPLLSLSLLSSPLLSSTYMIS
jgi:hypothetical protein